MYNVRRKSDKKHIILQCGLILMHPVAETWGNTGEQGMWYFPMLGRTKIYYVGKQK